MPRIWKTDEELIGYKVTIRGTDKTYEVLPWDGDWTENGKVKLFPIYCEVCSADKELFPSKILIRKGDIKKGYCPCGCALSRKHTKEEIRIICKRLADNLNHIKILRVNCETGKLKTTTMDTYCTKHNHFSENIRYSNITDNKGYFCTQCGKDGLIKSKTKSIDYFKKTFNLPKGAFIINSGEKNLKGHRYWYYFCTICSNDKYVKSGVCSGTFKILTGELQRGTIPCRCSKYSSIPRHIAEFNIDDTCKDRGYTFLGWRDVYKNGDSLFLYECKKGHINESNHHKFVTNGYGCFNCNGFGLYKERSEEKDTLYIIKLENDHESFYKVGRSFNVSTRFKEFFKYYKVIELFTYKDNHASIYELEQSIHNKYIGLHYLPLNVFGGSGSECFSLDFIKVYPDIIKTLDNKILTP